MLCSRVQNQLSAYCDYQLTGQDMLEIREHLGECQGCAREYAALRQVKALLGALNRVDADQPFTPEILERPIRRRRLSPSWLSQLFLSTAVIRSSAYHLATGAVLGLSVLAVSALQTPVPRDAVSAHIPVATSSEAAPGEDPLPHSEQAIERIAPGPIATVHLERNLSGPGVILINQPLDNSPYQGLSNGYFGSRLSVRDSRQAAPVVFLTPLSSDLNPR